MPQPYPGQHWKHGWIPLTPAAALNKAKKGPRPKKNPRVTAAAAEAGDILRRMRQQDAARIRRRQSITHIAPGVPRRSDTSTSRQADQALRSAARRTPTRRATTQTTAQAQTRPSRPATPTTPQAPARPAATAATPTTPETPRRPPSVERAMDDIRETYYQIAPTVAGRPGRVFLSDLRERLPKDLSRQQVDEALARLNLRPDVFLTPLSNQKVLTRRDRESAVRIGGSDAHMIEFEPEEPTPTPRRAPTPSATPTPTRQPEAPTQAGPQNVSRQADDAIRRAARRQPATQRRAEQPAQRRQETPITTTPSGTTSGAPVSGRPSDTPIAPNRWGVGSAAGNEIAYHDDGAIGTAIKRMGQDARMDIDGEPLANVLGRLATDAVAGRRTTQEMLDEIKRLRDRLPAGSAARRELDGAILQMDAPNTPPPQIPPGTLAPLRQLAEALHQVPAVRRDPSLELEPLMRLIDDFAAGRTGGRRILNQVRALANKRHESLEGKAEIDRLVMNALRQLEQMQQADRRALYPPTSR